MLPTTFTMMTPLMYITTWLQFAEEASPPPSLSLHLTLSLSPPPLSFFPSVFFSRDLQFLNTTLFLPTGPPPHAYEEREPQVRFLMEAWICDFLFDYYLLFIFAFRMLFKCQTYGLLLVLVQRRQTITNVWNKKWPQSHDLHIVSGKQCICWDPTCLFRSAGAFLELFLRFWWLFRLWKTICCTWLQFLSAFFMCLDVIILVLQCLQGWCCTAITLN